MTKVAAARQVGDFRPISLINSIFKIIFNVLSCKLKAKIYALIEPSQSAFIYGHFILDGVATAQEIMTAYAKTTGLLFPLSWILQKLLDTIGWDFLLKVLQARGFGATWCGWISSLLSSGFSLILINGQPATPSDVSVDLRKGTPSPHISLF